MKKRLSIPIILIFILTAGFSFAAESDKRSGKAAYEKELQKIKKERVGVRSCNDTFYLIGYFHGKTFTS